MEAWQTSREKAVSEIPADHRSALRTNDPSPTETLFNQWVQALENKEPIDKKKLNLLIKRFEVTKKVYSDYDENFRPVDKKGFDIYRLYLLFGFVLVSAFNDEPKLQYLNALLKVNDISTGLTNHFNDDERSLLNINVRSEAAFIKTLRAQLI